MIIYTILYIIAGISLLGGMGIVFFAPKITEKYNLADKKVPKPEMIEGMDSEEIQKYKKDGAILDLKLKGLLIAMPGVIIILALSRVCHNLK